MPSYLACRRGAAAKLCLSPLLVVASANFQACRGIVNMSTCFEPVHIGSASAADWCFAGTTTAVIASLLTMSITHNPFPLQRILLLMAHVKVAHKLICSCCRQMLHWCNPWMMAAVADIDAQLHAGIHAALALHCNTAATFGVMCRNEASRWHEQGGCVLPGQTTGSRKHTYRCISPSAVP